MTVKEKIEECEANELAGYTRDKMVEHESGFGFAYQSTDGASEPKTLVIAADENDISVE